MEYRVHCFPHTRGGGPPVETGRFNVYKFSPHAWGWTGLSEAPDVPLRVFPTRVGVDRSP